MIQFKRIDHFHICVPPERLEEAKNFYTEVIGLELIHRPDVFGAPGFWFNIGDTQFHIGVEAAHPRTIRHTALEVVDIMAARKHLENHCVEILEEPVLTGRTRLAFIDPFGNRMELLQITG